jgi:hypothetical protein
MGSIKNEKIKGYILDQDIVCVKCVTQEELKELMEDQIITDDEVQNSDEIFFCNRCENEIKWWGSNEERDDQMKSLVAKLGIILIGLYIFSYAEAWGADWRLYGRDDAHIRYYDAENMIRESENTVEVWLRQEYTDKGVMGMVKRLGKKYENIDYAMALVEINCSDKKIQTLSLFHYFKEGDVISSGSRTGVWRYIASGSGGEVLYEAVCK